MKFRIGLCSIVVTLFIVGTHKYLAGQGETSDRRSKSGDARQIERRVDNTVREYGVVQSAAVIKIKSEVKGTSTILSIVQDGSRVKKGDILIRLDDSQLQDQMAQQKVVVAGRRTSIVQVESKIAALKQRGGSSSAVAELAVKVAELEQARYLAEGGEYELEKRGAEEAIGIAELRISVAQKLQKHIEQEKNGGSAKQSKLLQAELAVAESRAELELAKAKKKLLTEFTHPLRVAELNLAAKQAAAERTQIESETKADLLKSEAEFEELQAELTLQRYRLEQIERQIKKCTIAAPQDGVVIYESSTGRRTTSTSAIEEGATVRERQPLLRMPDFSRLELRVLVHETRVSRLKTGQPVTIRVDAFPNRSFRGTVKQLNTRPEPASFLSPNVKEYAVIVSIDKPSSDLKIGLTAEAEIDVSRSP